MMYLPRSVPNELRKLDGEYKTFRSCVVRLDAQSQLYERKLDGD